MKTVTCEVKMTKERKKTKLIFEFHDGCNLSFGKGEKKKKNTNKMTGNGVKDEADNNVSELNKGKY